MKRSAESIPHADESPLTVATMTPNNTENQVELLANVLIPVANKQDAEKTAMALAPYHPDHVTVLFVIEKGEGVPDKTPVEQSETMADESFAAVRTVFPEADERTVYARDVVKAIFETAAEIDATAIVYRPRSGGRIMQFLSGDLSLDLVTQTDRPIIALPRTDQES